MTAITIAAYVDAARRARQNATNPPTVDEERLLAKADRSQIKTGVLISTWFQGCFFNALYLTPSRRTAAQIMPGYRLFTAGIKWSGVLLITAAAVAAAIALTTGVTFIWPFLGILAAAVAGGVTAFTAALGSLLRFRRWMRALSQDDPKPKTSLGVTALLPRWEISSLVSLRDRRLAADLVSTVNIVVPPRARIVAKARNRDLFDVYALYLDPVGGNNNLALVGFAPLRRGGPGKARFAKAAAGMSN